MVAPRFQRSRSASTICENQRKIAIVFRVAKRGLRFYRPGLSLQILTTFFEQPTSSSWKAHIIPTQPHCTTAVQVLSLPADVVAQGWCSKTLVQKKLVYEYKNTNVAPNSDQAMYHLSCCFHDHFEGVLIKPHLNHNCYHFAAGVSGRCLSQKVWPLPQLYPYMRLR
jgi:hypothetical protein